MNLNCGFELTLSAKIGGNILAEQLSGVHPLKAKTDSSEMKQSG